MELTFTGSDARDKIRREMQARDIPGVAVGYILDEARQRGAFTSGGFKVTVKFRRGEWRLLSKD